MIKEIETLIQRCDAELKNQLKSNPSPVISKVSIEKRKRKQITAEGPEKKKRKKMVASKGKKKSLSKKFSKKQPVNPETESDNDSAEEIPQKRSSILVQEIEEDSTETEDISDEEEFNTEDEKEIVKTVKGKCEPEKREPNFQKKKMKRKECEKSEVNEKNNNANEVDKVENRLEFLAQELMKEVRSVNEQCQSTITSEISKMRSEIQSLASEWREFRTNYTLLQSQYQMAKMYQPSEYSANPWYSNSILSYQPTYMTQRPPPPSQTAYFISPRIDVQSKEATNRRVNIEEVCLFQDDQDK